MIKIIETTENINEIGLIKDFVYDIDLVDNPKFTIHAARGVPFAIKGEIKAELDKMEKLGIIKPIDMPTPLVMNKYYNE